MIKMIRHFDIGRHYDSVTDGWRYIFGDNFHFGYFNTPDDSLDQATDNLIDELISLCRLKLGPETKILDAGCGIGAPAVYLHNKFGSDITGISTSRKGIDLANDRIKDDKLKGKVRFTVADITASDFPDESFDIVWVMESSHLIRNKQALFEECFRLLKPGGNILLCDVLVNRKYNFFIKLRNFFPLLNLIKTFGGGKTETPALYEELMRKAGFSNISSRDVSREVKETLPRWRDNINQNRSRVAKVFSLREINRFEKSIATLGQFFHEGFNCYYLFRAEK